METNTELPDNQTVLAKIPRFSFMRTYGFLVTVILIILAFGAGTQYGQSHASAATQTGSSLLQSFGVKNRTAPGGVASGADFTQFWEVWDLVSQQYFDKTKVDPKKMVDGAISGMVASLGDPYTTFLPPVENKDVHDDLGGNFEGVGMELGVKDKQLVVMSPLDDSPAKKAGILAGDAIVKINGAETYSLTLGDAVNKIRGPKDTKVTLELFRQGVDKPFPIELTRAVIHMKSVTYIKKDGNIAYIRLSRFGNETNNEWDAVIDQVTKDKSSGIVLDLRNNPGGFLDRAVYLGSDFVTGTIVKQQDADGKVENLTAVHKPRLGTIPVVVLINKGSASAAEILSGAIWANKRGTLVGETSFGKGTVQETQDFKNGAGIHITRAKWLTPNDVWVHEKGLKPDIEVLLTIDDVKAQKDPQLDKALELLRK